jgi:hypothetical protein
MSKSTIELRWNSIDDLPRVLRLSAASGPGAQVILNSADALRLARRIEDTRPVVLVTHRDRVTPVEWWFWTVVLGFSVAANVLPPALWLARVFQ